MKLKWPWNWGKEEDCAESQQALQREQEIRAKVEANEVRVEQVADELAAHRRTNHFSRLVEDAMHLKRGSN